MTEVSIQRDGKPQKLAVRFDVDPKTLPVSALLGFQVGNARATEGVEVRGVGASGSAGKAGLKMGDRITTVGGKKVTSLADWRGVTDELKLGQMVVIEVVREDKLLRVEVVPALSPGTPLSDLVTGTGRGPRN